MNFPDEITVGFQDRKDTYTKKLGFINYKYETGELKQEKTFKNWCNEKLGFENFINKPTQGFVINKGVVRGGDFNRSYSCVRVYDPRGFEFEISFDNFMEMLNTVNVIAQEITEPCVYAWKGNNVILVPINSDVYRSRVKNIIMNVFDTKEKLVEGVYYSSKKYQKMVFVGNRDKKDYFFDTEKRCYLEINKKILISKSEEIYDEIDEIKIFFDCFLEMSKNYNNVILSSKDKLGIQKILEEKINKKEEEIFGLISMLGSYEKNEEVKEQIKYEQRMFMRDLFKSLTVNNINKDWQEIINEIKVLDISNKKGLQSAMSLLKEYFKNEDTIFQLSLSNEYNGVCFVRNYSSRMLEQLIVPKMSYESFLESLIDCSKLNMQQYDRFDRGENIFIKLNGD